MRNRLKSMLQSFFRDVKYLVFVFIGTLKAKLFFNKNKINKLEIGAGVSGKKKGFITSDLSSRADYPYDLRVGLPFPDNSLDLIYAEHVFEHFHYKELIYLLAECYRVLKPDGVLSLVVPDTRIYLNAYFHPEEFDPSVYCLYDFGLSYKGKIDFVNYIFYMDGQHRYMFDEENALVLLQEAMFKNVHLRSFDPTLDQEARKRGSIYVEAIK